MKQPVIPQAATRAPAAHGWRVEFSPRAARIFQKLGQSDAQFRSAIGRVVTDLSADPKRFEKKFGKLAGVRAAPMRYRNAPWRVPFVLYEETHVVLILTIDRHDNAYRAASR